MARAWVQFLVGELRPHMPGSMAKVLFFLKGECKAEVYVPTPSQSKTYGLCTHNMKLHKNIPQTSRSQICLALSLLITFVVKAQKLETRKGSSNTRAAFCYCYIFPSLFQQYYSRKNYNFNNWVEWIQNKYSCWSNKWAGVLYQRVLRVSDTKGLRNEKNKIS